MDEPPEREPWELQEKPEGYDAYQYDPVRARQGQRLVIIVFLVTIVLLIVSFFVPQMSLEQQKRIHTARRY